jgi:hypothetical protein
MPISSSIDRFPAGRRNELMERLSRNALRVRGRKTTAVARAESLDALINRLGAIPVLAWPAAAAGDANIHGVPPGGGTMVAVTQVDASLPATTSFIKGDPSQVHTFSVPSVKQSMTATFSGNGNAKGRWSGIV